MITLTLILIIWGFTSIIRLYKICKDKGVPFNPFEGTLMDWLGFLIGVVGGGIATILLILKYLP
jgi:hypothetical protein